MNRVFVAVVVVTDIWGTLSIGSGILSKAEALAYEAFYAAKTMVRDMGRVRGGPWARPTLSVSMEAEVRTCAGCARMLGLAAVAKELPQGSLAKHLANVAFQRSTNGRLKPVMKRSGRSGKPGNHSRKEQVRRGILKKPSAYFKRLHRGTNATEARETENAKRIR